MVISHAAGRAARTRTHLTGRGGESDNENASQAERIRDSVEALCDQRKREDTPVGIEMFVEVVVDFLEAFRALEAGIPDVQAEVNSLEAELTDDEDGREA